MRSRTLPTSFVPPCLPIKAKTPPSGEAWLHEIKHDGFRVIARKDGARVKLYSRPGNDLTWRFPLIVEALARLGASSCIIDGEAVACGDDEVSSFNLLRHRRRCGVPLCLRPDRTHRRRSPARPARQRKLDLSRLLPRLVLGSDLTNGSMAVSTTARRFSFTPANLGSKASCPSGRTQRIAQGAQRIGSR